MLGALEDELIGEVLRQLQFEGLPNIFALACTSGKMGAIVWDWLERQTKLTVNSLPPNYCSRAQIFRMIWLVRTLGTQHALSSFHVGQSYFSFDDERDARPRMLHIFGEATPLAQLLLPILEVTSGWHYRDGVLQRISVTRPHNFGEIGATSIAFVLRTVDSSEVSSISLRQVRLGHAGAKEIARLLRDGLLPALTWLDLSDNDLSAAAKGEITRACKDRARIHGGLPAVCVQAHGSSTGVELLRYVDKQRVN